MEVVDERIEKIEEREDGRKIYKLTKVKQFSEERIIDINQINAEIAALQNRIDELEGLKSKIAKLEGNEEE